MPRPKKIVQVEEKLVTDETLVEQSQDITENEKPPTQVLIPFFIQRASDTQESNTTQSIESQTTEAEQIAKEPIEEEVVSKFEIHCDGQHIETVEDKSPELIKYLDLNRAELDERIQELWQTPTDPNDLIFFNFGEQKLIYNSYNSYFNLNGFAPVEPKVKSWMEYYLKKHNPITEEEVVIQLKGPLQYSFIPIKS